MTHVLALFALLCAFSWIASPLTAGDRQTTGRESVRLYEQHALQHAGDAQKGRDIFDDAQRTKCAVCHQIKKKGGEVGPDLTSIGGKFDRPHLIESLLKPSQQIVEGYRTSVVETTDGKVYSGIVMEQGNNHVTIADVEGRRQMISRDVIEQVSASALSLMPDNLAKEISPEEFTDLIAYLESLRPAKEKMGGSVLGPLSRPDEFDVQVITTGLDGATALEVLPDGRVLICEQTGRVRVVEHGRLLDKPFVTLPVDSTWERGVIGVTYDPDFPRRPYIYVCWVAKDPYPHHHVSRFTADGNVAVPDSEELLLVGDDQTKMGGHVPAGHQGGALHFGADGKLYIGIGEQTSGLPSQKLDTFLGKILRINADGTVPVDNPFYETAHGKYRAIWARGARNPFTFAIRRPDGFMLINDVGGRHEEINIGVAGANYGWPVVEHGNEKAYEDERFQGPIHWYPESSINGGDFCPVDSVWPAKYRGRYFFADFVKGWIKSLDPDDPKDVTTFGTGFRRPVDMRFAPDGSLFILLRNAWVIDGKFQGGTGSLLRIHNRDALVQEHANAEVRQSTVARNRVVLTEDTTDPSAGDLPAFKIETPSATFYLEKSGAGLSSLVDRDGNDWISFRPAEGSGAGGEYRGFPNAVYKEAGNYFHPRNAGTDPAKMRVDRVSADYVSIVAESESGHWACRYEFYPTHCSFSVTRRPKETKYWVLYEGVPGGQLDLDDWWMSTDETTKQPVTKRHDGDIPAPEWIAFGDPDQKRALVLVHHSDDDHPDAFYQMNEKMTVFGFGRDRMTKFQTKLNDRFSIGLVETDDPSEIARHVETRLAESQTSRSDD